MSVSNPAAFGVILNRTGALYFTVTVFSTVGFGDITPKTDPARIVAMVQMLSDLAVLAVVVRLILGAATRGMGGSGPQASRGADNREERGTLPVGTPNPPWWCLRRSACNRASRPKRAAERRHEWDLDLVDLLAMTTDRVLTWWACLVGLWPTPPSGILR